jgi:hypothetical protein
MRLAPVLAIGLVPMALAGCLSSDAPSPWGKSRSLLGNCVDVDTAVIQYVIVERPAGTDEINRRAWDRVDEQVFSYETRCLLEQAGLRIGIAGESTPGALRKLIDDPRTPWGHRIRTFALHRPAPLTVSECIDRVEFSVPTANSRTVPFKCDRVVLGFDLTVQEGDEGKALVKLVPRARYQDPSQLLPNDPGDRGMSTEVFPAAGIELALSPADHLVIGTDSYWVGTFGHAAFTAENDERKVQRLLVLKAARPHVSRATSSAQSSVASNVSPIPVAAQAGGARP